eukprot:1131632-Prymnesium_polylepis.1
MARALALCRTPWCAWRSVKNIDAAKKMGWRTVLVGKVDRDTGAPIPTPPSADVHVESLHSLPTDLPEIFA